MRERSTTYVSGKGSISEVVATDDRKTAAQYIERGYTLFTVPQMFGTENGVIVLTKEQSDIQAATSLKGTGEVALKKYEDDARDHFSSVASISRVGERTRKEVDRTEAEKAGSKVDTQRREDELRQAAAPLVQYLRENYHPHTAVIVTDEQVSVLEDVIGVPFPIEDQPILL